MSGPLSYPSVTRWSLSLAVERFDDYGERFAGWALRQMVELAVAILFDLLI